MSKELEALDDIQFKLKENCKNNQEYIWLCERTNLIEKSLKAQEEYVQMAEKEHEELMYAQKKLKALDIIKEVVLEDLVFDDKEQEINFSFGISTLCIKIEDKEKYDLLKEVLL